MLRVYLAVRPRKPIGEAPQIPGYLGKRSLSINQLVLRDGRAALSLPFLTPLGNAASFFRRTVEV